MERERNITDDKKVSWPVVSYDEFIDYLKSRGEYKENDPWIPNEETWNEILLLRKELLGEE